MNKKEPKGPTIVMGATICVPKQSAVSKLNQRSFAQELETRELQPGTYYLPAGRYDSVAEAVAAIRPASAVDGLATP